MKHTITIKYYLGILFVLGLIICFNPNDIKACTRFVYKGTDNLIITARTMDWEDDLNTHIWIFPRGIERNGCTGSNSAKWVSKYGSVITSGYDLGTTDGMNEAGLSANLLWLVESKFPSTNDNIQSLSIAIWVQYILDNFATVKEAVNAFRENNIQVLTVNLPGSKNPVHTHISVSDALGDSAIFEYIDGELVIHHDPSHVVLTNSPAYEEQLAINKYWIKKGGDGLPGSTNSSDRFAQASYHLDFIPKDVDTQTAIAGVFSLIRYLSVPYRINTPDSGYSSTQWRSVADQKNKVYYFESVLSSNTIWLQFDKINFSTDQSIKKLDLSKGKNYSGDVTNLAINSEPFKFLCIQ